MYAWFAAFGNQSRENVLWASFDHDVTWFFEIFFTVSIGIRFVTGYRIEGSTHIENHHSEIAKKYFQDGFIIDFVAWMPIWVGIHSEKDPHRFGRLVYLIKLLRLLN